MSTARRSSRLSQLSEPTKSENEMDVDTSSESEANTEDDFVLTQPTKSKTPKSPKAKQPKAKKDSKEGDVLTSKQLYNALSGSAIVGDLANDWVEFYNSKDGKTPALTVLLDLLIQISLVRGSVTDDITETEDQAGVLKVVARWLKATQEYYKDDSKELPEAPLTAKDKKNPNFKKNKNLASGYNRFWKELVDKGGDSAFTDEYCLDRLVTWLGALSKTLLRPMRHAAIVTTFHLCTGLLKLLQKTSAERKKREKQITAGRGDIKAMRADAKQLGERHALLDSTVKRLWKEVYEYAWKDSDVAIRHVAMDIFVEWCTLYPTFFMHSERFKYVVWLLADAELEIRLAATDVLLKLLEQEHLRPQLNTYCQRMLPRIFALTTETSDRLAVQGIKLLTKLREYFGADFADKELVQETHLLISADHADIRRAAAQFALPDILNAEDDAPRGKQRKGVVHTQLRAFLNFIQARTKHPNFPNWVVEAFWSVDSANYFLFNFEEIADILSTSSTAARALDHEQQLLLANVTWQVCKKLQATAQEREAAGRKELPLLDTLRQSFTEAFCGTLPELLTTHKSDDDILVPLLRLVSALDLRHVSRQKDHKQYVTHLIQVVKGIFTSSTKEEVLKRAGKILATLSSDPGFQHKRLVEATVRNIVDELSAKLTELCTDLDNEEVPTSVKSKRRTGDIESADFVDGAAPGTAPLVLTLLRLEVLSRHIFLNKLDADLLTNAKKVLETRASGQLHSVGPQAASSAALLISRLFADTLQEYRMDDANDTSSSLDAADFDRQQPTQERETDSEDEDAGENKKKKGAAKNKRQTKKKQAGEQENEEHADDGEEVNDEANGKLVTRYRAMKSNEAKEFTRKLQSVVDTLAQLLDTEADETDTNDLLPYSAFRALISLLMKFGPALEGTTLKSLIISPSMELEDALKRAFEAQLKPSDDDSYEHDLRLSTVVNLYWQFDAARNHDEAHPSTVFHLLAQSHSNSEIVLRIIKKVLADVRKDKTSPMAYASLMLAALKHILASKNPNDSNDEERAQADMEDAARRLASFYPLAQEFTTTSCSNLVYSMLTYVTQDPVNRFHIMHGAAPFVSKLTPKGAQDLSRRIVADFDAAFDGQRDDIVAAYDGIKESLGQRQPKEKAPKTPAKGKKRGKKRAQEEPEEGDEVETSMHSEVPLDQYDVGSHRETPKKSDTSKKTETPKKRTRKRTAEDEEEEYTAPPKKRAKKSAAQRQIEESESKGQGHDESASEHSTSRQGTPAKRSGGGSAKKSATRTSISVLRQGANESDSEQDTKKTRKTTPATSKAASQTSVLDKDSDDEIEQLLRDDTPTKPSQRRGRSASSSQVRQASQVSMDVPLTDAELTARRREQEDDEYEEEPRTSRAKRSRLSQGAASQQSKGHESEEEDDLSDFTPTPKKRKI